MPHLTLEVSANLRGPDNGAALLDAAHAALLASGVFDASDVKSRLVWHEQVRIGTGQAPEGYAHAVVELLSGRSPQVRKALGDAVTQALARALDGCAVPVQISCDTRDMDRASYAKVTLPI